MHLFKQGADLKPDPIAYFNRTRLAPTPSGYLHLGNLVSFVLTAGLARKHGARILLRIDDLDRDRVRPAFVQDIFETLHFFNIPWDEGPRDSREFAESWSQVHRMGLYRQALDFLASQGELFACECSRSMLGHDLEGGYPGTCMSKKIPLSEPGVSWRLQTKPGTELSMHDLHKGVGTFPLPPSMQHFIVRKKDGFPSYQLASVIDDIHFGVDLVVRGADLFESTLAQLYLSTKLPANPFTQASFLHHPLVHDLQGRKLSKSAGDTSIQYLRGQGKNAREILDLVSAAVPLHESSGNGEALFERLSDRWLM
jgi:glutamyl-tRNA synthetase